MTRSHPILLAIPIPFPVLSLLVALLALGCGGAPPTPVAAIVDDHHHDEAESSDLDRPVEALFAEACEHGIPTHTCTECRYEVGVVEAPPWLFDPGQGGELTLARVETRLLGGAEELTGEVRANGSRSVAVAPPAGGDRKSVV